MISALFHKLQKLSHACIGCRPLLWRKMPAVALACFAMSFASVPAHAAPEEGFLAGMEIEVMGEQALANALDLLSINVRGVRHQEVLRLLTDEALNDYLTPDTLELLPEPLRNELTQGVKLGVSIKEADRSIQRPGSPPPRALQHALDPKAQVKSTHLVPNASGILVPAPTGEIVTTDSVRAEQSWHTVKQRWNALPRGTQITHIDINKLPKLHRAVLFRAYPFFIQELQLRVDLPAPIAELMSRLEWSLESSGLEFRHKVPLNDPDLLLRDIEQLASLTGIRKYIENPTTPEPDAYAFSLHIHASKKGAVVDKEIGQNLNKLRVIELAERGRAENIFAKYGYADEGRSLISSVDVDHLESRTQTLAPKAEISRLRTWLNRSRTDNLKHTREELKQGVARLQKLLTESTDLDTPHTRSAQMALLALDKLPEQLAPNYIHSLLKAARAADKRTAIIMKEKLRNASINPNALLEFSDCVTDHCVDLRISLAGHAYYKLPAEEQAAYLGKFVEKLQAFAESWSTKRPFNFFEFHQLFSKLYGERHNPLIREASYIVGDHIVRTYGAAKANKIDHLAEHLAYRPNFRACPDFQCVLKSISADIEMLRENEFFEKNRKLEILGMSIRDRINDWIRYPDFEPLTLIKLAEEHQLERRGANTLINRIIHAENIKFPASTWVDLVEHAKRTDLRGYLDHATARFLAANPTREELRRFIPLAKDKDALKMLTTLLARYPSEEDFMLAVRTAGYHWSIIDEVEKLLEPYKSALPDEARIQLAISKRARDEWSLPPCDNYSKFDPK
jgi:hypothetical protein